MTLPTITYQRTVYTCPFAELFRPLTGDEERDLRASVSALGVRVAAFVYDSRDYGPDCVIDGANRLRLFPHLPVPLQKLSVTDETARRMAEDLNIARRQVTPAEARAARAVRVERVVLARSAGASLRAIADAENVSHEQVRRDLRDAGVTGVTPELPDRVTGRDGKRYDPNPPERNGSHDVETTERVGGLADISDDAGGDGNGADDPGEPGRQVALATGDLRQAPQREAGEPGSVALGGVSPSRRKSPPPKRPGAEHEFYELLNAIVALAGRVAHACNEVDADSKLRLYLMHLGFVRPRQKYVGEKHYGWRCVGLRDLYRAVRWAGLRGKQMTKDEMLNRIEAENAKEDQP